MGKMIPVEEINAALHLTIQRLEGELAEAQEEAREWAEAATYQSDEIQAVLGELEKAGWKGPASPGVEFLRTERDEAQAALAQAQDKVNQLEIGFAFAQFGAKEARKALARAPSPEVVEQVRAVMGILKRGIINGMRMNRWRNMAVVSIDISTLHKIAAALAALEVKP